MNLKGLIFVTGNLNKVEQLKKYLGHDVPHEKIDLVEIQSLDVEEIILHKVKEAYQKLNKPVLVEDTSLTFHALGKLPGPFIKWFLQEIGDRNLCRLLDSFEDKSATAEVCYAIYDGSELEVFLDAKQGRIVKEPIGTNAWGWNTIFVPEGSDETWAQTTGGSKLREDVLRKITKYLKDNNYE